MTKPEDSGRAGCDRVLRSVVGNYILLNVHNGDGHQTYLTKVNSIKGKDIHVENLDHPASELTRTYLRQMSGGYFPELTRMAENVVVYSKPSVKHEPSQLENTADVLSLPSVSDDEEPPCKIYPIRATGSD
ncbi:hypothetical protein GF345_00145 [Candidatus Woesearchaeota archaeon]|nr:hypothetical protein [Candidatus Woesearchaeota archaeon]